MMYSESHDQPACVIHAFDPEPPSPGLSRSDDGPAPEPVPYCDSAAAVGEGEVSTSQVRAIWKESERRMIRRSWTAVRRKCVPGLNDTREDVCLYISVKSMNFASGRGAAGSNGGERKKARGNRRATMQRRDLGATRRVAFVAEADARM